MDDNLNGIEGALCQLPLSSVTKRLRILGLLTYKPGRPFTFHRTGGLDQTACLYLFSKTKTGSVVALNPQGIPIRIQKLVFNDFSSICFETISPNKNQNGRIRIILKKSNQILMARGPVEPETVACPNLNLSSKKFKIKFFLSTQETNSLLERQFRFLNVLYHIFSIYNITRKARIRVL